MFGSILSDDLCEVWNVTFDIFIGDSFVTVDGFQGCQIWWNILRGRPPCFPLRSFILIVRVNINSVHSPNDLEVDSSYMQCTLTWNTSKPYTIEHWHAKMRASTENVVGVRKTLWRVVICTNSCTPHIRWRVVDWKYGSWLLRWNYTARC
jgi:hypothetical protein